MARFGREHRPASLSETDHLCAIANSSASASANSPGQPIASTISCR
jgi:hypothetical protein